MANTSPAGVPQSPPDLAQVGVGMTVVDSAGAEAGTVSAVQPPGTPVRPDTVTPAAERLMAAGYLRIDGSGLLSNDTFAAGDEVARVAGSEPGIPGVVHLQVGREQLSRAAP
ncbi:hypothetical protein GCM10010124_27590 [Pilimelia terevasa]|uniref:Uncharacterized protein n=1 Tax=Pilimelia terevasa TaxID=53372 RepID=A0A8J3FIP3_9ACTN|nr:hypothetical protein [Pilimelia terevasa]GGK33322.1 hypothetical protein GCM10010124_27590 [Pilimelia terevasa]